MRRTAPATFARAAVLALPLLASCGGQGGAGARAAAGARAGLDVRGGRDRPKVVVVSRDGNPRGAVAAAVSTAGVADDRGAEVPVALAGLVEARLRAAGASDATVVPSWNGYRIRAFVASEAEASALGAKLRDAMLAPAKGDAEGLASAQRKLAALAKRPLPDAALADVARCTGDAYGPPQPPPAKAEPITAQELEAWRAAAHGVGRVAMATAGNEALADAVGTALGKGGAWPVAATAPSAAKLPPADARAEVYELTPDVTLVAPAAARATIAVFAPRAAQAVSVAGALGNPRGAFAARIAALEGAPRVRDVTATAYVGGGCIAATLEWSARDLATAGAARVATGVALARQELAVEVSEAAVDATFARTVAYAAEDPRDAAERAAWWSLASDRDGPERGELRVATAVGLAPGKDTPQNGAFAKRSNDVRAAIDRAIISWHEPVVEERARVERGQGELWLLLGSTCGTAAEGENDAGVSALVAASAAEHVNDALRGEGARAEPWAAQDGIGIVVHGAARPSETPFAHARRLADAAARAFAAEGLPGDAIVRARAEAVSRLTVQDGARGLATLASALAPGHPSWIAPWGTLEPLGRASDASIGARAAALRAGPLRVAALANVDLEQAHVATRAIDRWVARRPGEARACVPGGAATPPRAGTYAADPPASGAEGWIAAPLPSGDEDARDAASVLAAALDGDGGLLARALEENGLARSASARVLGGARTPALVVRITTPPGGLDAAMAQTRALLDRLRQGALTDADRDRALAMRDKLALLPSLDPRTRLVALFRGEHPRPPPTQSALRALAASVLRDEALIIVAAQARAAR